MPPSSRSGIDGHAYIDVVAAISDEAMARRHQMTSPDEGVDAASQNIIAHYFALREYGPALTCFLCLQSFISTFSFAHMPMIVLKMMLEVMTMLCDADIHYFSRRHTSCSFIVFIGESWRPLHISKGAYFYLFSQGHTRLKGAAAIIYKIGCCHFDDMIYLPFRLPYHSLCLFLAKYIALR